MDLLFLATFIFALHHAISSTNISGCHSPQYLEIGRSGAIHCTFEEDVYDVLWYNSSVTEEATPFIQLLNSTKSGNGNHSEEYDICTNGTLIINRNVSLIDEHNFTAIKIDSLDSSPVRFVVAVITTVKPASGRPIISQCERENNTCFGQINASHELSCYIRDMRPAANLKWVVRTSSGETDLHFQMNKTCDESTCTSQSTTAFQESSLLSLLVCKADSPPGMLQDDEAVILTENIRNVQSNVTEVTRLISSGFNLHLSCSEAEIDLIVWKKWLHGKNTFEVLAYAAFFESEFLKNENDDYELKRDGSLVIHKIEKQDEGIYDCLFQNEVFSGGKLFNVAVYESGKTPLAGSVHVVIIFFTLMVVLISMGFILWCHHARHVKIKSVDSTAEYRQTSTCNGKVF